LRAVPALRDLGDLARVLDTALGDTDERRWQPPLADLDFDEQSPFFVGTEVGSIALPSHLDLIRSFATRIRDESSPWAAAMAREGGFVARDPEGLVRLRLKSFERGLAAMKPPDRNGPVNDRAA
jgi:hypothetical protein